MSVERVEGFLFLALFSLTVPAANWLVSNVGTACVPSAPCLIPVAPDRFSAPSGGVMIGLAVVLRDLVQRRLGARWALLAIALGASTSAMLASPSLVLASAAAFLFSELDDLGVYTPLQHCGLVLAVAVSSIVGSVIDSVRFLALASGSLTYLPGQVLGKLWVVLLVQPLVAWLRRVDKRRSLGEQALAGEAR